MIVVNAVGVTKSKHALAWKRSGRPEPWNGNLAATKFADAGSLTPESIAGLERAWDVRWRVLGRVAAGGPTMTHPHETSSTRYGEALPLHRGLMRIWASDPRLHGCLTTTNKNDIGILFLIAATTFFLIGGVLAMLLRAQLSTPNSAFMEPQVYNHIFTKHGTVIKFLFAIPFFEAMSMLMLPGTLGSRDIAFPRLGAYGLWVYIFGGSAIIIAMLMGLAPDGGWFMYPLLLLAAFSPGIGADVWLLGITSIEVFAIATAIEVIVTVLRYRAAGMSLSRMPIFAWFSLVVSVMILTAFPP